MNFKKINSLIWSLMVVLAGQTHFAFAAGKKGPSNDASNSAGSKKSRESHIVREVRGRGDQKKFDFDAADISGERKAPLGSLVNQNKLDKNYDFVKIRLRWTPEMVQSASSLDTGKASAN